MTWPLEGTVISGGACPSNNPASEAAPAFRELPKPVPMDAPLLSKYVAMWVWQEQVGLPVSVLLPSHAS